VTSGGAGKTTIALDIGQRLRKRGVALHFLSRGYGGSSRAVTEVTAGMGFDRVGDEPLLLAAVAPTWVGADRAAAARAAIAGGAAVLIMDDGLQNPTLTKTISLLVVDGRTGFGNGRLLPAGPLREPVAAAASRCAAAVVVGDCGSRVCDSLPKGLPVLRCFLRPGPATMSLAGHRLLAFAGIADPEKFFATLAEAGGELVSRRRFADHHPYRPGELTAILQEAEKRGLLPVTTAKDAARLSPDMRARVSVADIRVVWREPEQLEAILTGL